MVSHYQTAIGTSDAESISLLGEDLTDLMRSISFGDLAFWLVALRRPTSGESRLFNAVLVALADHGLTPSVLAARLTLTGAPESVQGAIASGLLGAGSRFLGVSEDAAHFLSEALAEAGEETDLSSIAKAVVTRFHREGRYLPGLGHKNHKAGDPRTKVLFEIARTEGVIGPHMGLLAAIEEVHPDILGKRLPVNGAGVCGAALADLGFPSSVIRGFALIARSAGLLGHLAEELRNPLGMQLYLEVDGSAQYLRPLA